MKTSKKFKLNLSDAAKGFIIAIITALLTTVYSLIESQGFNFDSADWKMIGTTTILAALAYISKNFLSNSKGSIIEKETQK